MPALSPRTGTHGYREQRRSSRPSQEPEREGIHGAKRAGLPNSVRTFPRAKQRDGAMPLQWPPSLPVSHLQSWRRTSGATASADRGVRRGTALAGLEECRNGVEEQEFIEWWREATGGARASVGTRAMGCRRTDREMAMRREATVMQDEDGRGERDWNWMRGVWWWRAEAEGGGRVLARAECGLDGPGVWSRMPIKCHQAGASWVFDGPPGAVLPSALVELGLFPRCIRDADWLAAGRRRPLTGWRSPVWCSHVCPSQRWLGAEAPVSIKPQLPPAAPTVPQQQPGQPLTGNHYGASSGTSSPQLAR